MQKHRLAFLIKPLVHDAAVCFVQPASKNKKQFVFISMLFISCVYYSYAECYNVRHFEFVSPQFSPKALQFPSAEGSQPLLHVKKSEVRSAS